MPSYYSHGKLLISCEYAVLDGAKALALPTKLGQRLDVSKKYTNNIYWKSLDYQNKLWFETTLSIPNFEPSLVNPITRRLSQCFVAIQKLQPKLFENQEGIEFISYLEFPQNWGLGSSSTLINNLAKWAKVDAFKLLEATFGGSGYDIACAQHSSPITFQKNLKSSTKVEKAVFNPPLKDQLFFVHQNQKQNSRDAIAHYITLKTTQSLYFSELNALTDALLVATTLEEFEVLMSKHETIVGNLIQHTPIKASHFSDYNGAIKSLGAWGGDFFLATGTEQQYFKDKGYNTIIPFKEMVL